MPTPLVEIPTDKASDTFTVAEKVDPKYKKQKRSIVFCESSGDYVGGGSDPEIELSNLATNSTFVP